ncbi:MAG: alpha/beta fold hydrolase [Promethearchaeota archaeon]
MPEEFAKINGLEICYEVIGDGEPLLLLHGFAMYKEFWIAQKKPISNKLKIITMDLRSCGKSTHVKNPFSLIDLVEDVKSLIKYLGIESINLAGHSLGGMIAQQFALKHPEKLNKLILLGTLAKFPGDKSGVEMYVRNQLLNLKLKNEDFENAFLNKMKLRFTRPFFKKLVENPSKKIHNFFSLDDLKKFEKSNTCTETDITYLGHAMAEHDCSESLSEIKSETLILAGKKDKFIPILNSEFIHEKIPKSTLKIFSGDHFFPLENAPDVNDAILNFII